MKFKRRHFFKSTIGVGLALPTLNQINFDATSELRVGIVGLSVHSAAFSKLLNDPQKSADLQGCRVVSLYHPKGNPDVDFTVEQLIGFEKEIREAGVKIVSSMKEMIAQSDVVMIETNDGRPHLEEVMPAFKAGLPVFIDKPVAENLAGVLKIYDAAATMKIPVFTSSALRYLEELKKLDRSKVLSATTFSPSSLEKSHTDLFWYGIHAVEPLFAAMGKGCKEVRQLQFNDDGDLVVGIWKDGRTGVVRGIRNGKRGFGGTLFTKDNIITLDTFTGYRSLVVAIVKFFKTKIPPVSIEETIEIYAFMEAAMESRKQDGKAITLESVIQKARHTFTKQ